MHVESLFVYCLDKKGIPMKKRILALQLVLLMVMSLFVQGCQKNGDETTLTTGTNVAQTTTETTKENAVATTEPSVQDTEETKTPESTGETVEETTAESTPETVWESQPETTKEPEATKEPEPSGGALGLATPASCGRLRVEGTQLVDESGNPIQLKGISTHGLSWFPDYVNKDCFKQLRQEWNANVIRLAMYTAENGGYCTDGDKNKLKQLIHDGVAYATELDMYVIIDWHVLRDQDPNTYKEDAKAFFAEMAETYADYNNVIYEICNEPNGSASWQNVKSYAEEVIQVIRQYDEDAVIIVGTPNWSQYVDQAAADPIIGYDNIMYALHFYAATHTDWLRNTMTAAIEAGLPVFVSEYGICDASGNGAIDIAQANEWVRVMNSYNVSYVAWSLCNKNESAAMISSSCNKTSGFSESDLSTCGKWVYEMLTGKNADQLQGSPVVSGDNQTSGNQNGGQNGNGGNQGNASGNSSGNVPTGTQTMLTDGDITCTAEMSNSWEAEGKTFYQYNLSVQNTSGKDCTGWVLSLTFSDNIEMNNGWSGNYTVSGNVLQIGSVDYNGSIPAGGCVKDIGFIISGPSGLSLQQ